MAGVQDVEKTVVVICTESRDVPSLGVIARVGERREVKESVAKMLVATNCFLVIEEEAKEVIEEVIEEVIVDEIPDESMVDDTPVVKRKRNKVVEE